MVLSGLGSCFGRVCLFFCCFCFFALVSCSFFLGLSRFQRGLLVSIFFSPGVDSFIFVFPCPFWELFLVSFCSGLFCFLRRLSFPVLFRFFFLGFVVFALSAWLLSAGLSLCLVRCSVSVSLAPPGRALPRYCAPCVSFPSPSESCPAFVLRLAPPLPTSSLCVPCRRFSPLLRLLSLSALFCSFFSLSLLFDRVVLACRPLPISSVFGSRGPACRCPCVRRFWGFFLASCALFLLFPPVLLFPAPRPSTILKHASVLRLPPPLPSSTLPAPSRHDSRRWFCASSRFLVVTTARLRAFRSLLVPSASSSRLA